MKWFSAWWNKPPTRRSNPKLRFRRLGVERLDDRILPAIYTWSAAAASTWQTAASWSDINGLHAVPGAADEAHFNNTSEQTCTLSAAATIGKIEIDANFTGTIDLGSRTLTADVTGLLGGGGAGSLSGGTITNGVLKLAAGSMSQNGDRLGLVYLDIGAATYYLTGGDINAASGTALDITVRSGGLFDVSYNTTIGDNIKILSGGEVKFDAGIPTGVTIDNGAVITVSSGGTFDLDCPSVHRTSTSTYIANSGLVEKTTTSATTEIFFGIQNVASTAVLSVKTGTLQIDNGSPGQLSSAVYQSAGATKIYNGATLNLQKAYTQDGGTLSAMGVASGTSVSTLTTIVNQSIYINGGSVVLGDGTTNHRTTLAATNADFIFAAAASLKFGINPTTLDNDVLKVNLMTITPGAKAVLDTTNLGGAVPSQLWVFVTATGKSPDSIAGSFTADVGTKTYTMAKDAATRTKYQLST